MTSVAASHNSTRSKRRTKNDRPLSPITPDAVEKKLSVSTAGLQLEPSSKSTSPRPEVPGETLVAMLGDRTRRSRCTPEFLHDLATRDSQEIFREWGRKVKVIIGPDAVAHYKNFIGGKTAAEILAMNDGVLEGEPLVVYAVTVVSDAGRRQVDYYTTWPQKETAHDAAEAKRLKHLHSQFRKTARTLDREFKRAVSAANIYGVNPGTIMSEKYFEPEEPEPATAEKTRPSSIVAPPPELKVPEDDPPPPASTTDSVISLPYLDFIRNVPNTHRIPLKVTNPDIRLSIISSISPVSPTTPAKLSQKPALASIAEAEPAYVPIPTSFSATVSPQKLLAPEGVARSDVSIRSSAASTTSTESRGKHHTKNAQEFLMVVLDEKIEKDNRTWHGLERQVSRSTSRSSSRVSLWDGPLARETPGRNFVHPPQATRPDGEDSSDEEDDWDNSPLIPPPATFFAMARSISEPRPFHPVIPPTLPRYRQPTSLGASPVGSFANLNYGPSPLPTVPPVLYPHSPYAPTTYASPYQTPVPVPQMSISPYHSPAVPAIQMSPYHPPGLVIPPMQVSPYQSPHIPMRALSRSGTFQPPFPE
ncbi:hypothetical protein H0H92_015099 [Tricholoma furcatifolium]|nr:hypothetical protein H0H92_015099 [Tricholoma furcatifolium]